MRINEKNLVYFSTCASPTDKEGYLLKKGEVNKHFQKRWFVLKGNLLYYFEKKADKEPIGLIILEGCTVELAETNTETYTFQIKFQGSGMRTYYLTAETQDQMEDWMKATACAGYDYMKLMVTELQRQLDEITAAEHASLMSDASGSNNSATPASLLETSGGATSNASSRRFNPFNTPKESEELDLFGAPKFNPAPPRPTSRPSRPAPPPPKLDIDVRPKSLPAMVLKPNERPSNFDQLHNLYGFTIKQRMAAKTEKNLLSP